MKIKPRLKEDLKKYLRQKQEEEEKKVTITAPYRLSSEEVKNIINLFPELKGKRVTQVLDSSLLAGLTIRHGSKVKDLSLKNHLMSLENRINELA